MQVLEESRRRERQSAPPRRNVPFLRAVRIGADAVGGVYLTIFKAKGLVAMDEFSFLHCYNVAKSDTTV